MVETILLSLASKVLLNLGSLAFQDVGLGWDLEDKLKKLEGTLWMIKAALVDAERKFTVEGYYYSIGTTVWHERLQDACYEADNVVDEFQYEDLRRQVLLRMHNHRSIGMQKLGFIPSSSGLNHELEDIGTDYLNQLCSIFFLEAIEQRRSVLNTCRMPEIIHDLAVFLAKVEFLNTANFHSGPISKMVKHVSFRESDCSGEEEVTKSLFKLENMRTVLFPFQGVGADKKGFVDSCISNFKYLHVLDLSNSCFQVLPRSIGNLKHLRFLDLSGNANIETLPNAICKLYNLETLRIWYCVKIRKLPKNIGNLISLRHLYLTTQQSCLPEKEIQRLTSLQSFRITGCGNLTSLPEGMQLLVALRTVTISECPNLTCLPSTMKNLAKLENLDISNCPNLNLTEWEDFRGLRRLQ